MQSMQPSKEAVREYMQQRAKSSAPPESPDRIREFLGWRMVEAERQQKR